LKIVYLQQTAIGEVGLNCVTVLMGPWGRINSAKFKSEGVGQKVKFGSAPTLQIVTVMEAAL